jgi:hypothetical protein
MIAPLVVKLFSAALPATRCHHCWKETWRRRGRHESTHFHFDSRAYGLAELAYGIILALFRSGYDLWLRTDPLQRGGGDLDADFPGDQMPISREDRAGNEPNHFHFDSRAYGLIELNEEIILALVRS